jgi:hypothetical protein
MDRLELELGSRVHGGKTQVKTVSLKYGLL